MHFITYCWVRPTVHIVFSNIATFCISTQLFFKNTVVNAVTFLSTLTSALWTTLLFSHSVVSDFATPWTAARRASLSFTITQSLLKLMSVESVMPSNHFILCRPLLLLPSILPSIRVFSNELALCIRWPKYWSFSFSISPSNEYSGLISFRIDWFDLFAV